jgi:hypothetical protein
MVQFYGSMADIEHSCEFSGWIHAGNFLSSLTNAVSLRRQCIIKLCKLLKLIGGSSQRNNFHNDLIKLANIGVCFKTFT